jgi:hypothetical protein
MIERIVLAKSYDDLAAAAKALDRILLWNNYVVPQWSFNKLRTARWDRFSHPDPLPRYGISAVVVGRRQGGQDRKLLDHRFRGSNHTGQPRPVCRTTIHLDAGYDALIELTLCGQPDVAQDRANFVARIQTRTECNLSKETRQIKQHGRHANFCRGY